MTAKFAIFSSDLTLEANKHIPKVSAATEQALIPMLVFNETQNINQNYMS